MGLTAPERPDGFLHPTASAKLAHFRRHMGLPIWRYAIDA